MTRCMMSGLAEEVNVIVCVRPFAAACTETRPAPVTMPHTFTTPVASETPVHVAYRQLMKANGPPATV